VDGHVVDGLQRMVGQVVLPGPERPALHRVQPAPTEGRLVKGGTCAACVGLQLLVVLGAFLGG
jgi:hypothetical protein